MQYATALGKSTVLRRMGSLLIAIGAVVVGTVIAAIAVRVTAHRIDKALEVAGVYDKFSEEELREILEEIGEKLPDNESTTIIVSDGTAYWLEENGLMCAPIDDEDEIDFDLAVQYNAIEAPKEELRKILSILDAIKENT